MHKRVINFYGSYLILLGMFLLLPLITALIYGEQTSIRAFSLVMLCCFAAGGAVRLFYKADINSMELKPRDGYFLVTTVWLISSAIGCVPYILTGSIPGFVNAFFETASGFTTTGSTIINDIEVLPRSVLMWRSLTQWLGGMGIVVLFVALMPRFGIKARNIASAETPGPTVTKLTSRFTGTAQVLYIAYILLTLILMGLLLAGDMSFYDALNHALTTMATGGFSPYNASIAHFDSYYITWVLTIFMFIAGTNFELFFVAAAGHPLKALRNEEFRLYAFIVLAAVIGITASLMKDGGYEDFGSALTDSAFQVTTLISTTGYATADFDLWPSFCKMILLILMITGGSSSSTAGGIKMVRILVLFKMIKREIRLKLHDTIVDDVGLDGHKLLPETITYIVGFITMYVMTLGAGILLITLTGDGNIITNFTAVLTCISNVGPGFDAAGPTCNFDFYCDFSKTVLSLIMIAGRLELSTFFIIFSRFFWDPNRI